MNVHHYAVAVIRDESGARADFDPIYSPPLVEAGIVSDVIPEDATSVVVWATSPGLSDDMAAQVVAAWDAAFTALGVKVIEPEPVPAPPSRKVPLPIVRAKGEADAVYLDRVLVAVAEKADAEFARIDALPVPKPPLEIVTGTSGTKWADGVPE